MIVMSNSIIPTNSLCHLMTFMEKDKVQFRYLLSGFAEPILLGGVGCVPLIPCEQSRR
jgi:hypothetical protein